MSGFIPGRRQREHDVVVCAGCGHGRDLVAEHAGRFWDPLSSAGRATPTFDQGKIYAQGRQELGASCGRNKIWWLPWPTGPICGLESALRPGNPWRRCVFGGQVEGLIGIDPTLQIAWTVNAGMYG